jgi:hypothetical protein
MLRWIPLLGGHAVVHMFIEVDSRLLVESDVAQQARHWRQLHKFAYYLRFHSLYCV